VSKLFESPLALAAPKNTSKIHLKIGHDLIAVFSLLKLFLVIRETSSNQIR